MSDETRLDAGARLAEDLRRIRELRNLTLSDMNAETKIPRSLLESFEEQALFDHPQFNRVYLRSFVRTYATTVGIEPERAADALEQAFEGHYGHDLAKQYLDDQPARRVEPDVQPTEERPDADAAPLPGDTTKAVDEAPDSGGPADQDWDQTSPPSRVQKSPPPSDDEPPEPSLVPPRRTSQARRTQIGFVPILGGIAALGFLVLVIWMITRSGDTATGIEVAEPIVAEDVSESSAEESVPIPRSIPTLEDSIVFYIVAVDGSVAPMRVTVDNDLRRPYWIDQGDSIRFAAANRIVFEERLDVIRLNLLGENYPTGTRDDRGRIVVTRDSAEAFLESLRF